MEKYLFMAAGAVLGAISRYGLAEVVGEKMGTHFVYGTLIINLIGSFVLGLFLVLYMEKGMFTENTRYLVAVGWCASFTTYSTFSWDTFRYIQEGNLKLAAANVTLTLLGCLLATWAGVVVAKAL